MLRLTSTKRSPREVVLVLEGQIIAEWVELLEEECVRLLQTGQSVLLDLANISYVDQRGVRLLRDLAARSVTLINCPPLVDDLVKEAAS